jgi:hypothetical protein
VAAGAAGAFFDLGFYSLMVGSTGVGLRLAINLENTLRVTLAVVSPLAFSILFGVFSGIGYALVATGRNIVGDALPSYLLEEGRPPIPLDRFEYGERCWNAGSDTR